MEGSSAKKEKLRILLFKAPKEDGHDPYEQELSSEDFLAYSIPVLEFQFVNLDILRRCLEQCVHFSAIVFTSQRAVDATCEAVKTLEEQVKNAGKRRRRCFDLPCCVVGPGTLKSAEAAGFCPDKTEAGNADKLADYIIKCKTTWKDKDVLYPCGNLRKDTLSVKLKNSGFPLKEIEVYQTIRSGCIAEKLGEMIDTKGPPDVVVYFSPSGVQFTADLVANGTLSLERLKVVAIGPTTAKELENHGFTVHGTAETPDARGVLQAVLKVKGALGVDRPERSDCYQKT